MAEAGKDFDAKIQSLKDRLKKEKAAQKKAQAKAALDQFNQFKLVVKKYNNFDALMAFLAENGLSALAEQITTAKDPAQKKQSKPDTTK